MADETVAQSFEALRYEALLSPEHGEDEGVVPALAAAAHSPTSPAPIGQLELGPAPKAAPAPAALDGDQESPEVEGSDRTLMDLIIDEEIPSPPLVTYIDWCRWRRTHGRAPKDRLDWGKGRKE